jgi:hypothetical protein
MHMQRLAEIGTSHWMILVLLVILGLTKEPVSVPA